MTEIGTGKEAVSIVQRLLVSNLIFKIEHENPITVTARYTTSTTESICLLV